MTMMMKMTNTKRNPELYELSCDKILSFNNAEVFPPLTDQIITFFDWFEIGRSGHRILETYYLLYSY